MILVHKKAADQTLIHAGENKMAQTMEGAKPEQKNTVSWFEFLFDTTGDLLKKHLGEVSAG